MHKTTVIAKENRAWDDIISKCDAHDFYHTRSYHALESREGQDKAVLFVCNEADDFIAMPLLIRKIPGNVYYDCTSVYGYVGPVSNLSTELIQESLVNGFQKSLEEFFRKENIIAAFSRLHPLIASQSVFNNFGSIRAINKTVAIDMQLTQEEQWKDFRKSNKSEINQLRKKKGYTVKEVETEEELAVFVAIYNETMQRVNAGDYYCFELDYFKQLLNSPDYNATILIAIKEGEIAAGAVFTVTHTFMQYHLAGTGAAYSYDTPMKLILDEARLKAKALQLDFLHLGGGVGGSDEDSLFRFKSGFSKRYFQFGTWQYIANPEAYKELVSSNGVTESEFFPLYRAPKNKEA
jgi:hypothetical protein